MIIGYKTYTTYRSLDGHEFVDEHELSSKYVATRKEAIYQAQDRMRFKLKYEYNNATCGSNKIMCVKIQVNEILEQEVAVIDYPEDGALGNDEFDTWEQLKARRIELYRLRHKQWCQGIKPSEGGTHGSSEAAV